MPDSTRALIAALLFAFALSGCSDARLAPLDRKPPGRLDNTLRVSGRVCTSDPATLEFPTKVLFVIDTSQSMNSSDPIDPAEPDLTRATQRSRAIRDVVTQFVDIGVTFPPTRCNTGQCARGELCGVCGANAICLGPDCWPDPGSWSSGLPICPPLGAFNGRCLPLCNSSDECPNADDRCTSGVCSKMLDPGVEFAVIRFGSAKQVLTRDQNGEEGFTNDPRELVTALPQVNNGGSVSDYQGALAEAYTLLSTEMKSDVEQGTVAINRSKYVVIFLSDGRPDPPITSSGDWDNIPADLRADLLAHSGGTADVIEQYNVPHTILRRVKDIVSLQALYGVGSVRVHTAFLSPKDLPVAEQDKAAALLEQMAAVGKGTFRNFRNGESLNFLHVDYSSLRRVFKLKNFIATNINARPEGGGVLTDSDGDGIEDKLELAHGTHWDRVDSDSDGFSDTIEHFFRSSGWDALDPTDSDCPLRGNDADNDGRVDDTDGDGLADCEERFVGTHRLRVDSDADGIPDGLELRFGTNAVSNDVLADLDFDGLPNGTEIRLHTDPSADDAAHRARQSYRYDVVSEGHHGANVNSSCYRFEVENIQLVTSEAGESRPGGWNTIYLYLAEAPFDDPDGQGNFMVSCVMARYDQRTGLKLPAKAHVVVPLEAWKSPADLDPRKDCVCPDGAIGACTR